MKKAFTLTEMMITVILIGVLASMALPGYRTFVEKGRTSEARHVLGLIRQAEIAYYTEHDAYTNQLGDLGLALPSATCNGSYFYRYTLGVAAGPDFVGVASRCDGTAGAGKSPNGPSYQVNISRHLLYGTSPYV